LSGEVDAKSLTPSLHLGDVAAQISTNNPLILIKALRRLYAFLML
jgi:hypothetical protein